MKQILFFLCIGYVTYIQAQVPVVLNDVNMPFAAGQSFSPVGANLTGFVLPSTGPDQTWDYSGLVQTNTYYYSYVAPPTATFPTATFADTGIAVSFIAGTVYYTDFYYIENSSYVGSIGTVTKKQEYNIGTVTGGAQDSCTFPVQFHEFDSTNILMKFPATENSAWNANYTDKVDFNLTVVAYGINNVPCKRVSHVTKADTVIAWGSIVIPAGSGSSIPYEVLLVKRQTASADSFYMNGTPASPILLGAFGLTQGQITISNRYYFWRPGSVYPALFINFGSDNFTTPTSVYFDGDAEPSIGINENLFAASIQFYPDQAGNCIYIKASPGSIVSIFDLSGKKLFESEINSNNVSVPTGNFDAGLYLAKISDGNASIIKKFTIAR